MCEAWTSFINIFLKGVVELLFLMDLHRFLHSVKSLIYIKPLKELRSYPTIDQIKWQLIINIKLSGTIFDFYVVINS